MPVNLMAAFSFAEYNMTKEIGVRVQDLALAKIAASYHIDD